MMSNFNEPTYRQLESRVLDSDGPFAIATREGIHSSPGDKKQLNPAPSNLGANPSISETESVSRLGRNRENQPSKQHQMAIHKAGRLEAPSADLSSYRGWCGLYSYDSVHTRGEGKQQENLSSRFRWLSWIHRDRRSRWESRQKEIVEG